MLRSLTLLALVVTAGCSHTHKQLLVDPCTVLPEPVSRCLATPLNQPSKPSYERDVIPSDVVFSADDYSKIQKFMRNIIRECGDRCS